MLCFASAQDRTNPRRIKGYLTPMGADIPLQHSTGGKEKLGATSKMGERTLRRLLIIGASAVLRWAARHGAPAGSWIARMLACKPPMLVRVVSPAAQTGCAPPRRSIEASNRPPPA